MLANIFSGFIFLINPTLWFSFGVAEVSTNTRLGYLKLTLFLSLIGLSIFPWGDGYERYKVFYDAGYYELVDFLSKSILQGDVIFSLVAYCVNYFGFNYQYVQFCFVFLGYSLIFFHLRTLIIHVRQKERLFLIFLILFLIDIIALANNLRYMLATIMFVFAISNYENFNNKAMFVFWSALAGLTHFYAFFLFFLYFFVSRIALHLSQSKIKRLLLWSIVFSFIFPLLVNILAPIIQNGDGLLARKFASYLLGGDGKITKMVSSPAQFINHSVTQLPYIVLLFYFYFHGDRNCLRVKRFLLFSALSISLIYFFSVYLRIGYFTLLYGLFLLIASWGDCIMKVRWRWALFISSFIFLIFKFIYFERIMSRDNISLINENSLCIIVSPIFMVDNCLYSGEDIYKGNTQFRQLKMESLNRTIEVTGG
ncbi:EpsG family protein [Vibrio vulnificus]|nr:EpsG family protein [Vibrio vulnificus]ELP4436127.1 EpsG family protein [Vibrio vulnificus]